MNAAIYCRVSTDKQELEQQIAACSRFAESKGLQIKALYSEIGSGKSFAREEFQKMLQSARAGELEGVVVFRFDRLGRNAREVVMLFDELEAREIKIFSVCEGLDTSTPIGKAMRDIICILAQLERENISEATRHRLQALKNLGKKLGRREREFDVQRATELRTSGQSWRKIAVSLKVPLTTLRRRLGQRAEKAEDEKGLNTHTGDPVCAEVGVCGTGGGQPNGQEQ